MQFCWVMCFFPMRLRFRSIGHVHFPFIKGRRKESDSFKEYNQKKEPQVKEFASISSKTLNMFLPPCSSQVPFPLLPSPDRDPNAEYRRLLRESDPSMMTPIWYFLNKMMRPMEIPGRVENEDPKNAFTARIDVTPYSPEELNVRLMDDCLIVEGKHEDKKDEHGHISRHFVRRYTLPENTKREDLLCNLSSDGVLSITAPKIPPEENKEEERRLPIKFTGQPARSISCCEKKGVKLANGDPCPHVPSAPKSVEGDADGLRKSTNKAA